MLDEAEKVEIHSHHLPVWTSPRLQTIGSSQNIVEIRIARSETSTLGRTLVGHLARTNGSLANGARGPMVARHGLLWEVSCKVCCERFRLVYYCC